MRVTITHRASVEFEGRFCSTGCHHMLEGMGACALFLTRKGKDRDLFEDAETGRLLRCPQCRKATKHKEAVHGVG